MFTPPVVRKHPPVPGTSRVVAGLLLAGVLLNCGGSGAYKLGKQYLQEGLYDSAIAQLESAEQEAPDNGEIKRDLGLAYFKNNQTRRAVAKLREAYNLRPKDRTVALFLGLGFERLNAYARATQMFEYCLSLGGNAELQAELRARIRDLHKQRLRSDVRQRIARYQRGEPIPTETNALAVLYFRNLSHWDELTPILKGTAELLSLRLAELTPFQTVERLKVQFLLEELQLTPADFFDRIAAEKAGKLLGATFLISGSAERIDDTTIQFNAGVVSAQSGALVGNGFQGRADLAALPRLAERLLVRLARDLDVPWVDSESTTVGTTNSLAFIAFSKGLDFEDRGLAAQARFQYRKALELDPEFAQARTRLEALPERRLSLQEIENLVSGPFGNADDTTSGLAQVEQL